MRPAVAGTAKATRRGGTAGSGHRPLLVGAARAVPDLEGCAVGGAGAGGVQALVGLWVDQVAAGGGLPLLGAAAVTVPDLYLRAVAGTAAGDVQALAERAYRAVGAGRPALAA